MDVPLKNSELEIKEIFFSMWVVFFGEKYILDPFQMLLLFKFLCFGIVILIDQAFFRELASDGR